MRDITTNVSLEDGVACNYTKEVMLSLNIPSDIIDMVALCHHAAIAGNWWHDAEGNPTVRNFGECIALIHSEISEAMEGGRKDAMDEHCPEYASVTIELADALIRIFDLAGALNLSLGEAFLAKLIYNKERSDHKIENRTVAGGKQF